MNKIILASASPRRQELLRRLGLQFTIQAAGIAEQVIRGATPEEVTARVAAAKAEAVEHPGKIVVAADTAVVLDGEILGKPASPREAEGMLRCLSGRAHRVLTALALCEGGRTHIDVVCTTVYMRPYTAAEIAAYIASGDPLDKAGAYAVQNPQFHPVARIHGCYQNVVGLPLCHLSRRLLAAGVAVPTLPPALFREDVGGRCPVALSFAPPYGRAGGSPLTTGHM